MSMLYMGCPMWGYKGWVQHTQDGEGIFPPHTQASEFLRLYSRHFSTVEGNTTFYAQPSAETVARWVQETPEAFRFCPKVAREISHMGRLDEERAATLAFVERMRGLGTRLGPMFLQLPPAFGSAQLAQLAQLEAFLHFWPSDVQLAVEVRHPDFYTTKGAAQLDTLLERYRVARVIMDTRPIRVGTVQEQQMLQARERKPNLPLHVAVTSNFAFVRYIGHPTLEVNTPFFEYWSRQLAQWLTQGLTLYVFCHCPYEEHSPMLCERLYQRVMAEAQLPLGEPMKPTDMGPIQARLF